MWKKVKIEGANYLLKHAFDGNIHRIHLTDLVNLWFEDIEESQLLLKCKEMNKLVEASDDVLLSHVMLLVDSEKDDVVRTVSVADSGAVLHLQTVIEGFKFRMKFALRLASSAQFYEEVTCPLLVTIAELERRQLLLMEVVKSKDVEIQEYKLEGGQITRKAVETTPFNLDEFSQKVAGDLSRTKSHVVANPSHALSTTVQSLIHQISCAPIVTLDEPKGETKLVQNKKTLCKLKSPAKSKKLKFYEDGDSEDDNICNN